MINDITLILQAIIIFKKTSEGKNIHDVVIIGGEQTETTIAFALIDFFRNSLLLEKLAIFEQIFRKILSAYEYIGLKNFTGKISKRAILITKWSFERSLMSVCP